MQTIGIERLSVEKLTTANINTGVTLSIYHDILPFR